jgi:tripartite-type tricarboxylate transporter receptor subunit TctC
MAEAGVRDVEAETWFGLFGPRGLPPAVLARLEDAAAASLSGPEFAAFLARQGAIGMPLRGQAFRDFIAAEVAKWRRFAEATGFRIE